MAAEYGALHLSSDGVRASLSRKAQRSGERVFAELHRRFERAVAQGRSVVLDSTAMSPRFRALLRAHREQIVHVHLVLRDLQRFEERERSRTDRPSGTLSAAAFQQSQHVEFHDAPDIVVQTDAIAAQEVYARVSAAIRARRA